MLAVGNFKTAVIVLWVISAMLSGAAIVSGQFQRSSLLSGVTQRAPCAGTGATRCSEAANLPPAMRQIIPSRIWRRASHPLGKAAALDPRKELRSLHSCAEQPDRQDFAKSSLPACPVLLRCRSACKLFLPDLLRRMASSWCAHIMAALLRKSIVACSRSCCCQGTMLSCKKLRAFKSTSGAVLKSSPYTLYKL